MNKVCCLLLFSLAVFSFNLHAARFTVKVVKVSGTAQYRTGGSGHWTPIKQNLELAGNSQIKTDAKSEVSLEIPGKGVVKVHEMSYLKLDKLDLRSKSFNIRIKLYFGRLWNRFKKNLEGESSNMTVETPAAVAAVRGTQFYVDSEQKSKTSKIGVWEGSVEVKSTRKPGFKMVNADYEIIVLYNKPLQDPVKMAREEANRAREFQQAIDNMGMAAAFPAARGMVEINDMHTNQARDTLNRVRMQKKGGEIAQQDFKKLKLAIARLYADTKYHPGKELSGREVKKVARDSLVCLLKNTDRTGKKIRKWKGPYIDSDLKDPFGGTYGVYFMKTPKGTEILMLYSYGVDKMPGGDNDEEAMYRIQRLIRDAENVRKNK